MWKPARISLKSRFPRCFRCPAFTNFVRIGTCSVTPRAGYVCVAESGGWANYQQTDEWQALMPEPNKYTTHVDMQVWGPSPVMRESLRPGS